MATDHAGAEVVVGRFTCLPKRAMRMAVHCSKGLSLERLEDRNLPSGLGPDGFGYTGNTVPFQNNELQGDPAAFRIIQYADEAVVPVDLGTNTFNFYGVTYTGASQLF